MAASLQLETVSTDEAKKCDIIFQDILGKSHGNIYTTKHLFMQKGGSEADNIKTITCDNRGNAENADNGTENTDEPHALDLLGNMTPQQKSGRHAVL